MSENTFTHNSINVNPLHKITIVAARWNAGLVDDLVHAASEHLKKIGYRYFKINKRLKKDKLIIKSFQEHYLPQGVTGKIDFKTFKISHFLANKLKLA